MGSRIGPCLTGMISKVKALAKGRTTVTSVDFDELTDSTMDSGRLKRRQVESLNMTWSHRD